jgi:glycosyltransferase involved in cell wall biosynthesis
MVADWVWPPNKLALDQLLRSWSDVRRRVAGARLLLAGRGLQARVAAPESGVEVLGPVASSAAVLAKAAVVAFPCPPSSGPKIKVLEALAHGIPVVTTAAGVEGLVGATTGAVVVPPDERFGQELAALLLDPARRSALGRAGRAAVIAAHAPRPAARARVEACATLHDER